jgi:predicted DNA-binding antitoxin AbrB/MazE fold protein
MTTRIHAVYERGVFRPTEPVTMADGTAVEITVSTESIPQTPNNSAAALSAIANLPQESPDDGFSGADHDDILYPKAER